MKILVLDNYDSFTYNLVHIIRELGYGENLDVYRGVPYPLLAAAQKELPEVEKYIPLGHAFEETIQRVFDPSLNLFKVGALQ